MAVVGSEEDAARLDALRALDILDTPFEERFDRITRLAMRLFGVKGAIINLIDEDRLWTKSACGVTSDDVLLIDSLSRQVVAQNSPLEISDVRTDDRFAHNRFVGGRDSLRFYIGYPLTSLQTDTPVGTLCVFDSKPRDLTDDESALLRELTDWAEAELNNLTSNHLARELVQRQQRLEVLLRSLPEGVLVVGSDGIVEEVNAACRRMFGGDAGVGEPLTSWFKGLPAALGLRRRAADRDVTETRPLDVAAVRTDGTLFAAEITCAPLSADHEGGLIVLVRDLRQLSAAEVEYRRQRRRTEVILSALAEGVIGLDPDATVLYANLAAARMLRCRTDDLLGRNVGEVLLRGMYPPSQPVVCRLEEVLEGTGVTTNANNVIWRADGTSTLADLTLAPIMEGERLLGAVVSMVDVSERHALKQRENEFVAVVSHELRTPLTSIKASLGLLKGQVIAPLPTGVLDIVDIAMSNTDRLARLVNDLLDAERLAAGAMPMDMAMTDVCEMLDAVVSNATPVAESAGVRLAIERPRDLRCEMDGSRITQAVANLVANAVKFSPPEGTVRVAVKRAGERLHILVQDWGRGIPPDKLERIFDRFGQAEVVGDIVLGGTGLGLPIARSIAEAHGGRLTVNSQLGKGSTFCIDLPASQGGRS